ncbi:MAG: hypothetical protein H6883_09235 [Rhodobiaceae bacterium]|nr:hypothetical protein [Rhodobiaceae bacterium]
MRELSGYTLREWLRGLPASHGFKELRNDAADRYYSASGRAAADAFLARHGDLAGRDILLTVAYNMPEAIAHLARAAGRHMAYPGGPALIVADNSRKPEARREIARIANANGLPYLPLPPNPVRQPSRNHGVAINWAWRNILAPLEPARFGLWDHDLLPLERVDMAASLADQPVYGVRLSNDWGWHLWAGYCFFDFSAVGRYRLNFSTDLSRKLDTGGRNSAILYSHLDMTALRFASLRWVHLRDRGFRGPFISHFVDRNFHISGAAYLEKMPGFFHEMVDATLAGIPFEDIAAQFTEPMDEAEFPYIERQWK